MSLTEEQQREWDDWIATRPASVREVADARPPWHLYRVKATGQLATVDQYDEALDDGAVTLSITAWYEWLPIPYGVFGMRADDLEVVEPFGRLVAKADG